MGVFTGDLLPRSSGSASLGTEMSNGMGGFTGDIRPYANVHFNSGILHDAYGQSGVIRYANSPGTIIASTVIGNKQDAIEISVDGGANFPLRLGGATDGFAGLGPHGIVQGLAAETSFLYLLSSGNLVMSSQSQIDMEAVQQVNVGAPDISFTANQPGGGGTITLNSFGNIAHTASVDISATGNRDINLRAGFANVGTGGQINLSPFQASGQLEFRFGPHQAWYAKLTHDSAGGPFSDGFWPLPHSGQISQMISDAGGTPHTLQAAYDGGNEVELDAAPALLSNNIFRTEHAPIVIQETTPGAGGVGGSVESIRQILQLPGVVASGHTATPDLTSTFAFGVLAPGYLALQASGTATSPAPSITFATTAFGNFLSSSGVFLINSQGGATLFSVNNEISGNDIQFNGGVNPNRGGGQIRFNPFDSSGASGQLTYEFGPHEAWYWKPSYATTGGPKGTGAQPLPHSGQIIQMIAENAPAGNTSLDDAYENGATISIDEGNPVIVHEPHGGLPVIPDLAPIDQLGRGLIVASGHSASPENVNTYSLTDMYPGQIIFKSSGITGSVVESDLSHTTSIGYLRGATQADIFTIGTSGRMLVTAFDDTQWVQQGGNFIINSLEETQKLRVLSRDDVELGAFSNTSNGSGRLGYRFGPYESWHQKQSFSPFGTGPNGDGYWPIPHSGQILQMILENGGGGGGASTLQEAYEGNPNIFTSVAQNGPVQIVGTDVQPLALYVSETDPFPHIQMSGVLAEVTNGNQRGALWMQAHAAPVEASLNGVAAPTTQAESDARSLGPALPMYNTGSGITNLVISSGIGNYINATGVAFEQGDPARLDSTFDIFPIFPADGFMRPVAGSGVVINVAGAYRISYIGVVNKTAGNLKQAVQVEPRIRYTLGREDNILGAVNGFNLINSDEAAFSSVSNFVMTDLEAGEALYMKYLVSPTPMPDFDTVEVFNFGNVMTIEYLGPKRFGKFNRNKVSNP